MPDCSLIITGFMGSGKSSVGKVLAKNLGLTFIDLDAQIVAIENRSINEIFASDGEKKFREIESCCLVEQLKNFTPCVLATGGGTVLSVENRKVMKQYGVTVNLDVTIDQVVSRISGCKDRPLLAGNDAMLIAEGLLNDRKQFYDEADIKIDTNGKSVEDVADEVLSRFKGFCN